MKTEVLFVTFLAYVWTVDCFQASIHTLKLQKADLMSHVVMLKPNRGLIIRPSCPKKPALQMSGLLVDSIKFAGLFFISILAS